MNIQLTVGVAGGVPVTFISVGPEDPVTDFDLFDLIHFFLSQKHPPQVLTTSYGVNEPDMPTSVAKFDSPFSPFSP
jgi:tripeptidyl-peptidase I